MTESTKAKTATDAGLKKYDQLRIAFRLMAAQGGKATLDELYKALQAEIPVPLSSQGKDTFRSYINRDAVKAGWVNAYVPRQTHWTLTAEGMKKALELSELHSLVQTIKPPADFDYPPFVDSIADGKRVFYAHWTYERLPHVIAKFKASIPRPHRCEVCDFDFESVYGEDYIECHHTVPLSELTSPGTDPSTLALVCANCHRMLHHGALRSIQELRAVVHARRTAQG